MLSYSERIELRDKLVNGEISVELAKAKFWANFKEGQKSWHTKDWQERRGKHIKEECQICNSKVNLTLQHLSHPKKYSEYLKELQRKYSKVYVNSSPEISKSELSNYIQNKYDFVPVPFCPNCNSSNPKKRVRKLPQYRCSTCKHEFDNPVYKSLDELISIFYENEDAMEVRDKCFISKEWRKEQNLSNIRYWLLRELATSQNATIIEKEAFLLYLNDGIKYLSFEDTITACRKCAYYFDIMKMELCPKCKLNYKGIQYATCIQCLPEDKRKEALDSIQFAKEMRDMHGELGID